MKRRQFITLLGGAAAAWPIAARAQQPAMPVIGFLNARTAKEYAGPLAAFRRGLSERGYVEGQNVLIEYRWAEGHQERLPALAADLVRRRVAVIVAAGAENPALAAKAATTTIPIVFNVANDPVKTGLVQSLARPVGNLTGVSRLTAEITPKRVELLREVVPTADVIGFMVNPTNALSMALAKEGEKATRALGLQLHIVNASSVPEFEAALATLAQSRVRALLITGDGFFNDWSEQLGALTVRHGIPAIYQLREFVAGGGLMSYGTSLTEALRMVGVYTGQILAGAKPADLPVQQQAKIDFVINLKSAKALGLAIPLPLLGLADEVIE